MMNNYLQILEDSLKKKLAILEQIEEKSQEQALMLRDSDVSLQQIDENMDAKTRLIEELEPLDNGFEGLYETIREELLPQTEQYSEEIQSLQKLIAQVTEKSASIQALEARNKAEIELVFSREKKKLQSNRNALSVASNYYQNMNKVKNVEPQFLDRKK